jgi:hypothetical protein
LHLQERYKSFTLSPSSRCFNVFLSRTSGKSPTYKKGISSKAALFKSQ